MSPEDLRKFDQYMQNCGEKLQGKLERLQADLGHSRPAEVWYLLV